MSALIGSWQFWALLAAVFAAMTAIFAKLGVQGVGSDMAAFIRTAFILPTLALYLFATGQWENPSGVSGRSAWFLGLSALATAASWTAYFRALKLGDASRVAPIDKLSVVFVALLGALLLGERLSALAWLGVALIAAGAVLVGLG
jgi:transporter family protein